LLRRTWTDEHYKEIDGLLRGIVNREDIRPLRRALREPTREETQAIWQAGEKWYRDLWLREHSGRTRKEYDRMLGDDKSEVWEWRRAKGAAAIAERADWERDHPGEVWPEHLCALSDREYSDYGRWERQRKRRRGKADIAQRWCHVCLRP
jgi:hypothetical protein